jgi:hypothetical protein
MGHARRNLESKQARGRVGKQARPWDHAFDLVRARICGLTAVAIGVVVLSRPVLHVAPQLAHVVGAIHPHEGAAAVLDAPRGGVGRRRDGDEVPVEEGEQPPDRL